jgi:hypothetical protein
MYPVWGFTLREEHRMWIHEKEILCKIFGLGRVCIIDNKGTSDYLLSYDCVNVIEVTANEAQTGN